MNAAHKYLDRDWLRSLSGAELLTLRIRYGKSVSGAVNAELNRRAGVATEGLPRVPELVVTAADAPARKRVARRSRAA